MATGRILLALGAAGIVLAALYFFLPLWCHYLGAALALTIAKATET